MKRFVIVTCLFKRHELSRIVLSSYARQRERLLSQFRSMGFSGVEMVAVGSEGGASRMLVEDCGWHYFEHQNRPLSDKWNFACDRVFSDFDADAAYIVGSDDFSSDAYVLKVAAMMADGADLAGTLDCYLGSPRHKRALHILPTRHTDNAIIGAGRAYSRRAHDLLDRLPYDPGREWGIDPAMDRRCKAVGITQSSFMLEQVPGAMLVDLKTSENIWPYLFFRDMGLPADYHHILSYLDQETREKIELLRDTGDHPFDENLDPLLHRIASALLTLLICEAPTVVEFGKKFCLDRVLEEHFPYSRHITRQLHEPLDEHADAYVMFDSDLTLNEHFSFLEKVPHNGNCMISVPQIYFESYEEAEKRYQEVLPNFSIKVIGRWWLGCGTKRM